MNNRSRDFYWTREFIGEIKNMETALKNRLQNGEPASAERYNEELRKWETRAETRSLFTPYYRAQMCYVLIFRSEIIGYPPVGCEVPTEILAAWGRDIARDGLRANVNLPDDRQMRKILSRPCRTASILWEEQGHRHQTDGMTLMERIDSVQRQIENGGNRP